MNEPNDTIRRARKLLQPTDNPVAASRTWWSIAAGLPLPTSPIVCPQCSHSSDLGKITLRYWHFHRRSESPHPYRCDISFKCRHCAHVWWHGVAIPEALYTRHMGSPRIDRRQGLKLLEPYLYRTADS